LREVDRRDRDDVLRERVPLLRAFAAPPDDDFFEAGDLRAPLLRDAPEPEDFALLARDLPPLLFERDAVEREPVGFDREADDFAREPLDLRVPLDLRALPLLRDEPDDELDEPPELALVLPSIDHLPDITR
jgi:hypothetical protein